MDHRQRQSVRIWVMCAGVLCLAGPGLAADGPRISEGTLVTFLYQITVPGTNAVTVRDVGQFVQGRHQVLPVLERAVNGMKVGEEKQIEISAEEGFGPYDDRKKKTVSRAELPSSVKEGDILEDRAGLPATVKNLSDSSATLDYNHPLAGKALAVQISILRVVKNPG